MLRLYWGEFVLPRWAKEDGVDVFWGPAHRLPSSLDDRIARVLTVHDIVWLKVPETMSSKGRLGERFLMPRAIRSADLIVAVSQSTADDLRQIVQHDNPPIVVVPPGAPTVLDEMRQPPSGPPYILFVGTLEPRKNLVRLLDAYQRVVAEARGTPHLLIVGNKGWKQGDVSNEISRRGLHSKASYLGRVSDDALSDLYRGAMFLVMPSLYEGFGLPIVEANARGVPVLTSNVSSMPEVGGLSADLVDPHSVADIGAGLQRMIFDREHRERLASAARANAARYSWTGTGEKMSNVFREALARRRRLLSR